MPAREIKTSETVRENRRAGIANLLRGVAGPPLRGADPDPNHRTDVRPPDFARRSEWEKSNIPSGEPVCCGIEFSPHGSPSGMRASPAGTAGLHDDSHRGRTAMLYSVS